MNARRGRDDQAARACISSSDRGPAPVPATPNLLRINEIATRSLVASKLPPKRVSPRAHYRASASHRKEDIMPAKETNVAPRKMQPPVAPAKAERPTPLESVGPSPFRTLERFADEVTRIFDDFGLGRGRNRVPDSGDLIYTALSPISPTPKPV